MVSIRQIKIIVYLLNEGGWVTGDDLADFVSLNRKTLLSELDEIENYFGADCVIETGRKGYRIDYLSDSAREEMASMVRGIGEPSLRQRSSVILIYLMFLHDYISMQELADRFYLSKTAVSLEIDVIRRWMARNPELQFEVSKTNGIRLAADESVIRIFLSKFATVEAFQQLPFHVELAETYSAALSGAQSVVSCALEYYECTATGEMYRRMIRYYAVSIMRNRLGYPRRQEELRISEQDADFWRTVIAENFAGDTVENAELNDFHNFFNACDFLDRPDPDPVHFIRMKENAVRFDRCVRYLLGYEEPVISDLKAAAEYLSGMDRRTELGYVAVNNINEYIAAKYPLACYLTYRYFHECFGHEASRESSFFSIQIAGTVARRRRPVSILLVTNNNESVIRGIKDDMSHLVPDAEVKKVMPDYRFEAASEDDSVYEIFLTTEMNIILNDPRFHYIQPVMKEKARFELVKYLNDEKQAAFRNRSEEVLKKYYRRITSNEAEIRSLRQRYLSDPEEVRMYPRKCALLIRIKDGIKPEIIEHQLNKATVFGSRKIRSLLEVSFPKGGEETEEFFAAVSELLKEE